MIPAVMDEGNKRTLVILIAVLSALAIFYLLLQRPHLEYNDVTVEQAKQLIVQKPRMIILDVRTESEYAQEHIEGAINMPLSEIDSRLSEMDPEDEFLVYCTSGSRSSMAIATMLENEYTKIYHLPSGIIAWRKAGYPVIP